MTRENVIKLFPEATDEQITALLNQTNGEVVKEKEKLDKLKAEMDELKESATNAEALQKKIEEIEQSKLTEKEKIENELKKANQKIADLERIGAIRDQREVAALQFKITAEQAKQVIKDDGTMDYAILGQIIAEKETNAVSEYEKKKLAETQNPNGGSGNGEGSNIAKDMAIASAKRAGAANESILKNYRR